MMSGEESYPRNSETTPDSESLLEKSSAPTLRDLRMAAAELLATIRSESDSQPSHVEESWKAKL